MKSKAERVGIYGGTFNPIHHGHLLAAREARERLSLNNVLFLPNARSPLRKDETLAEDADRLEMLSLALEDEPGFEIEPLEMDRGGISYTVGTLRALQSFHAGAELFFLMGADSLLTFDRWVAPDEIVSLARVVALPRPGFDAESALDALFARAPALRDKVEILRGGRRIDISATDIRERVAAGQSIRWLVPDAVADFIARRGLFQPHALRP